MNTIGNWLNTVWFCDVTLIRKVAWGKSNWIPSRGHGDHFWFFFSNNHVYFFKMANLNILLFSFCSKWQVRYLSIMLLGKCERTKRRVPEQQHTIIHPNGVLWNLFNRWMQRSRPIRSNCCAGRHPSSRC